ERANVLRDRLRGQIPRHGSQDDQAVVAAKPYRLDLLVLAHPLERSVGIALALDVDQEPLDRMKIGARHPLRDRRDTRRGHAIEMRKHATPCERQRLGLVVQHDPLDLRYETRVERIGDPREPLTVARRDPLARERFYLGEIRESSRNGSGETTAPTRLVPCGPPAEQSTSDEIGRASCREREESWEVAGTIQRNR